MTLPLYQALDVQHFLDGNRDPATTDDASGGFSQGSIWVYPSTGNSWICADATVSAAVWRPLGRIPVNVSGAADGACVLPSGGTWWYQVHGFNPSGALLSGLNGTAAGGTTIGAAAAGRQWRGFAVRIS